VSRWTPCKRAEFVRRLRQLGFDGPFSGTRHQFLVHSQKRLVIPSNSEYSIPQLRMMISEVEAILDRKIGVEEWNGL
jgi:predicted RNA binding protein YcfA (HicA-like mRNA interferase family)